MIDEMVKDLTLDYLKGTEVGANLQKIMKGIEKAQEAAVSYINDDSPDKLKTMKMGTVLTFSVIMKMVNGKPINKFTDQDWKDVALDIADYAILQDGQQYSISVFLTYTKYVDVSVEVLEARGISIEKCDAIRAISDKVRNLSDQLKAGSISEVEYTEQCLWLLLEAMIKLIATYNRLLIGEDLAEFTESVATFAFEYGRYSLYKQEQALLQEYLDHQCDVDIELGQKLSAFREELKERSKMFEELISDAFDTDISKRLKSTVDLARNAGVDDYEILDSIEKVDEFFL